ncbi:MAG: hypothetical protein ACTTH8_07965 [Treponema sp.]
MTRIFKYTFLHRIPAMVRYNSVLVGMACIELLFLATAGEPKSGFYALWLIVTLLGLIGVPLYLLIRCSSGYARSLLFTDESYLVLTLPVKSEHVLAGRMLAGLAEFAITSVIATLFGTLITSISSSIPLKQAGIYKYVTTDTLYMIFIRNYQIIIVGICMLLVGFLFIGTSALFSQTAVRSFTVKRKKGIVTLCSILVFVLVVFFIGKVQEWVNIIAGFQFHIDTYNWYYADAALVEIRVPIHIPIVSMLVSLALSAGFFSVSAWLLRNRIDV